MSRRAPTHPDDIAKGLRAAAVRRADAEQGRAAAMADTVAWLLAGHEMQLSVTRLARLSGLTRKSVYAILREQGVLDR